jgi:hypothetical protein
MCGLWTFAKGSTAYARMSVWADTFPSHLARLVLVSSDFALGPLAVDVVISTRVRLTDLDGAIRAGEPIEALANTRARIANAGGVFV